MRIRTFAPVAVVSIAFLLACASPLRKARVLAERGDPESARQILLQTLERDSSNTEAWLTLAALDDSTGRTREAIRAYRRALELTPENAAARRGLSLAYLRLADSLLKRGHRIAARDTLRLALRADSTCAPCWERMGDTYASIAYMRTALGFYEKAAERTVSDTLAAKVEEARDRIARAESLAAEGEKALHAGRWKKAEALFQRALELDAENDDARYGLHMSKGLQLYRKGGLKRLWAAISEFGHAAEIRPHRAEPHYWLARCYEKKNRNEFVNAIDEYEKAARLEPDSKLGKESARRAKKLRARKKLLDDFWGR